MHNSVDIVLTAIDLAGARDDTTTGIVSLDNPQSPEEKKYARIYEMCMSELLEAHPWSFATDTISLKPVADTNYSGNVFDVSNHDIYKVLDSRGGETPFTTTLHTDKNGTTIKVIVVDSKYSVSAIKGITKTVNLMFASSGFKNALVGMVASRIALSNGGASSDASSSYLNLRRAMDLEISKAVNNDRRRKKTK